VWDRRRYFTDSSATGKLIQLVCKFRFFRDSVSFVFGRVRYNWQVIRLGGR
jgi:hypothetical protein